MHDMEGSRKVCIWKSECSPVQSVFSTYPALPGLNAGFQPVLVALLPPEQSYQSVFANQFSHQAEARMRTGCLMWMLAANTQLKPFAVSEALQSC